MKRAAQWRPSVVPLRAELVLSLLDQVVFLHDLAPTFAAAHELTRYRALVAGVGMASHDLLNHGRRDDLPHGSVAVWSVVAIRHGAVGVFGFPALSALVRVERH